MLRKRISTSSLTAVAVGLLVLLIGFVTWLAYNLVNETAVDEFESSQLQLVTSLSQQTQGTLNGLESDLASLTIQEDIQSISASRRDSAIVLLAAQMSQYPPDVIRSITRFDEFGVPRYAYPDELNTLITEETDPADYIYQVPESVIALTGTGDRVTAELPIALHHVSRTDQVEPTVLLIAPVDASNLNTELLAIELNMNAIFADLFDFIDLGDTGQLWVMDGTGTVQYSARPTPTIDSIRGRYSDFELTALVEPITDSYPDGGDTRLASIARARVLNENLVIFLSSNESEATANIGGSLLFIGIFGVVAIASLIGLGTMFVLRIGQETRGRKSEMQRRQTSRALLEISRALNSSLDLKLVLQRILVELNNLVQHDSASILLVEEQELRSAAYRGAEGDEAPKILQIDEARAAREVIARGYSVVINDTNTDERWSQSNKNSPIASWMGVPLRVREQMVGVLNVNSHVANRFSPKDVELAETFADQASIALQNARLHELEVQQIEQELIIARGIQTSLLPDAPPDIPELELISSSLPARQVSGDYYQYLPLADERLVIAIGDVQGKGIPAALMMAVITTAMRDEAVSAENPAELLQALNTRLLDRMKKNNMNSALILATFNVEKQELDIANAGMVQPYLRPAGSQKFDFVPVGGYPLGVSGNIKYSFKTIPFPNGQRDGDVLGRCGRSANRTGEFFGFERIEALLDELPTDVSAQNVLDRILKAVEQHLDGLDPQDDTTIMVLRSLEAPVKAQPEPEPILEVVEVPANAAKIEASISEAEIEAIMASALPPKSSEPVQLPEPGMPRRNVELSLPSHLGFEMIARGAVEAMAREIGFEDDQIEDLKTAVAEACMNAIEHGNLEEGGSPVQVLLSASATGLEVRIMDTGKRVLSPELPMPGQGDMRGWGLFFIKNLVDRFEVRQLPEGGNVIFLATYIRQPENGNV